jgi:hypothetical protein
VSLRQGGERWMEQYNDRTLANESVCEQELKEESQHEQTFVTRESEKEIKSRLQGQEMAHEIM